MKRILLGVAVIGTIGGLALYSTNAFFSDTEASTGNTFTAGKLDLKVNGQDNPTQIVSFSDLKPGDDLIFNKTLLSDDNPAWVWLHLKDLLNGQGIQTEPEIQEENGVPKSDIQNYLIYDLTVGNTVIIATAAGTLLPDAYSCWIPLGQIPGGTTIPMLQSFHFDETVTNWAQGDTLSFTEEFYATQVRNNPNPIPPDTGTGRVWNEQLKRCVPGTTPSVTPTPTPLACIPAFANTVEANAQGTRKNGTAVLATRTNPLMALVPQTTGLAFDPAPADNTFYSLGFTNGTLIVKFNSPFFNGPGDDLKVYEVTGGPPYPDEKVKVEASPDGTTWTQLTPSLTKDGTVDLGVLPSAQYVRLTDVSDINLFEDTADGYDVDGVQALCAVAQNN